jgi:modification methylase
VTERTPPGHPNHPDDDGGDDGLPVTSVTSVWLTCQQPARDQRRGRYVPATRTHPAKMLPALARHAITAYTAPGDLVLDPMCGAGTTLVEAVHAGRHAVGVDIEPRFTTIAAANLDLAAEQGATGTGTVLTGDSTRLRDLLPPGARGRVALVLTSPPYGNTTHGLVHTTPEGRVAKDHHRYGRAGRGNLAYAGWDRLLDGFTQIMAATYETLRPGGIVVITARPVRRHRDDLIDLPSYVLDAAVSVGLQPVERCVALLAAVREDRLVHRASMFALLAARRARARGIPVSAVAHEDVLVLRKPKEC